MSKALTKAQSTLQNRLQLPTKNAATEEKMSILAERSNSGNLSSFGGLFSSHPLSDEEKQKLHELLSYYTFQRTSEELEKDLIQLCQITTEVRSINNQAILLHGDRIQRVQALLTPYHDGAFSAWLVSAYGNRQTPYNFLLYYQLHQQLSRELRQKLEEMPKPAIYTLASRKVPLEEKTAVIADYHGETKQDLLEKIRQLFPLKEQDQRGTTPFVESQRELSRLEQFIENRLERITPSERKKLISSLEKMVEKFSTFS